MCCLAIIIVAVRSLGPISGPIHWLEFRNDSSHDVRLSQCLLLLDHCCSLVPSFYCIQYAAFCTFRECNCCKNHPAFRPSALLDFRIAIFERS